MNDIESRLTEKGCRYEIIHHERNIRTAPEGAEFLGIEIGQTAPTLIIIADGKYYSLIFSGDREQVDFEKIARVLGCKRAELANRKEVKNITGSQVGSISMLVELPCILDRMLFRHPFVYGGTGKPKTTLKISPTDLARVNRVAAFFE
ncbi:MAG: YbaK/EbsC family protein [Firmicutes bacterium]|nr:YbaK/EbsC family protein [Bacillota bacterium]